MSKISTDYEKGFAKLLPDVWRPTPCDGPKGRYFNDLWNQWAIEFQCSHGETESHQPPPYPDVREDEALAWRALEACYTTTSYAAFVYNALFNHPRFGAMKPKDALYAAIEAIGRES